MIALGSMLSATFVIILNYRRSVPVNGGTVITMDYGIFQGAISPDGIGRFFRNIPFAAPPIGTLRFKPPQPPLNLPKTAPVDAVTPGHICMQPVLNPDFANLMSEDCLNLNIFTPITANQYSKLPVIVFIHGSNFGKSFTQGSNADPQLNFFNFLAFARDRKAVVVVPNYRLNAFGFLASTEMSTADATNVGLQDQRAVFRWVRKYIENFGGNPGLVTAWGQAEGATSVVLQQIWMETQVRDQQDIFDLAILHSAGAPPLLNTLKTAEMTLARILDLTGCNNGPHSLNCLQKADAGSLLKAAVQIASESPVFSPFMPTVDRVHIPTQPMALIDTGKFKALPTLMIDNANEGAPYAALVGQIPDSPAGINAALQFQQNTFLFLNNTGMKLAQKLYPLESFTSPFYQSSEMYSDAMVRCPQGQLAQALVMQKKPIYKARFGHIPLRPLDPSLSTLGVYQKAEFPFTMGLQPFLGSGDELRLSQLMILSWFDFIGNVTPGSTEQFKWAAYDAEAYSVMTIDLPFTAEIKKDPAFDNLKDKCHLWISSAIEFAAAT